MKEKWNIWVNGYGRFEFEGAEAQAEDRRIAKGQHEGGVSRKWRVNNQRESDKLTAQIVDFWESGQGVPQSLLARLRKAKETELETSK
jgi:hypothetical protein